LFIKEFKYKRLCLKKRNHKKVAQPLLLYIDNTKRKNE